MKRDQARWASSSRGFGTFSHPTRPREAGAVWPRPSIFFCALSASREFAAADPPGKTQMEHADWSTSPPTLTNFDTQEMDRNTPRHITSILHAQALPPRKGG